MCPTKYLNDILSGDVWPGVPHSFPLGLVTGRLAPPYVGSVGPRKYPSDILSGDVWPGVPHSCPLGLVTGRLAPPYVSSVPRKYPVIFSVVMSGLVYPIAAHWGWSQDGWLHHT